MVDCILCVLFLVYPECKESGRIQFRYLSAGNSINATVRSDRPTRADYHVVPMIYDEKLYRPLHQ